MEREFAAAEALNVERVDDVSALSLEADTICVRRGRARIYRRNLFSFRE